MARFFKEHMSHERGSLLVEIVLVTFLFAILSVGLISTVITSTTASKQGTEYVAATGYIKEGIEAVRSIRNQDWSSVVNGSHGLSTVNGYYEFSGTSDALDGGVYTRTVSIEDVYRTGGPTGDIAPTGVLDSSSKKVTVNITWDVLDGRIQNIDAVFYVYNMLSIQSWVQTLTADFTAGTQNSTTVTSTANGEVELKDITPDWSSLANLYSLDLTGIGNRIAMQHDSVNDVLYILAEPTTGNEFISINLNDVSENTPSESSGIDLPGMTATDFVVSNGYAYIASNLDAAEVTVVRLSDMTSVNTIDLIGTADATSIDVTGTTLVIGRQASADDEMYVYDISSPEGLLTELGSTELGQNITDIAVSSTQAFLTSDSTTQEVFSVSLVTYVQDDVLDLSGDGAGLTVDLVANNLYVGTANSSNGEFYLVDVSSPASLSETSTLETGSDVNDISIDSDEAFASLATTSDTSELVVVDLSTFTQSSSFDTTGTDDAECVEIFGAHIYVAGQSDAEDLVVLGVDINGWSSPSLVYLIDEAGPHNAQDLVVEGNYLFGVTQNSGTEEFFIEDISTPSSPVLIGTLELGADGNELIVDGNYAYVATTDGSAELMVIDISNKAAPTLVGVYDADRSASAESIAISGTTLYLGRTSSKADEFIVLDISTPSSPSLIGSLGLGGDAYGMVIDGNEVYIASSDNGGELTVLDASTPAAPSQIGSYDLSGSTNAVTVAIYADTLVIGRVNGSTMEMALFDVSTPSSPSLYSETELGGDLYDVVFNGANTLFMATDVTGEEFMSWDISDPTAPVQLGSYDLGDQGRGVYTDGTVVYLASANQNAEFYILGEGTSAGAYAREGMFTSQAFDTGSAVSWSTITWTESGTGNIQFRIRTASTELGLETATWVGSDGTSSTTYSTSGSNITTDPGASGTQWVQWKAYLTGDTTTTPVLEDVTLEYSP